MKATMSEDGVLLIEPESGAEAYALSCWETKSRIEAYSLTENERFVFRGSKIVVYPHYPVVKPVGER